jgi:hypothetical protein
VRGAPHSHTVRSLSHPSQEAWGPGAYLCTHFIVIGHWWNKNKEFEDNQVFEVGPLTHPVVERLHIYLGGCFFKLSFKLKYVLILGILELLDLGLDGCQTRTPVNPPRLRPPHPLRGYIFMRKGFKSFFEVSNYPPACRLRTSGPSLSPMVLTDQSTK